jgi:hypothetical protein
MGTHKENTIIANNVISACSARWNNTLLHRAEKNHANTIQVCNLLLEIYQ